jgi:predicted PurR-regulated permease PerM
MPENDGSDSSITNIGNYGSSQLQNYYNLIENNITLQKDTLSNIQNKNNELMQKQEIQINQLKEIQDKENLLLTRSRMLQISQDRNSYKKKIIYSLIALIFFIFIITLVIYVYFSRKMKSIKT